jgi:hypothetical protein
VATRGNISALGSKADDRRPPRTQEVTMAATIARRIVSLAESTEALAGSTRTVRRYIAEGHLDGSPARRYGSRLTRSSRSGRSTCRLCGVVLAARFSSPAAAASAEKPATRCCARGRSGFARGTLLRPLSRFHTAVTLESLIGPPSLADPGGSHIWLYRHTWPSWDGFPARQQCP